MTDELKRPAGEDTYETDRGLETHESTEGTDAPPDPDGTAGEGEDESPWLKEGADAPDAADIADPSEQR
jgi:hypothetical protein